MKDDDQRHYANGQEDHKRARRLLEKQGQLVKRVNQKRLGIWKRKRKTA